jgi:hypothetical protein
VRPCTASDVVGVFGGANALTGGQLLGYLAFGNRSDTACRLEGRPAIDLLDASGVAIALTQSEFCFGAPCVVESVILAPHTEHIEPHKPKPGLASLVLYWPSYGDEGPPCSNPRAVPAATVRLALPEGGGTTDIALAAGEQIAPCHTLGVGVFQATH